MLTQNAGLKFIIYIVAVFVLAPLLSGPALAETSDSEDAIRPTMRSVFEDVKVLVPLSLREERWKSPEDRDVILAALARLEKSADVLEKHGRNREVGFNELALNLMGDVSQTYEFYRNGRYDESRFYFSGTLNSCVSCHVRRTTDRSFPLANELMDEAALEVLSPRERAWMLVTVRRFDEALATWEGLIQDQSISASQLDANGVLLDYLNVAIRVRGDLGRVNKTLKGFEGRTDLPIYLQRRVREWRDAISQLDKRNFKPGSSGSFDRGVELAKQAGIVSNGPYGRDGFVQDLASASHLVRWLEKESADLRNEKISRNRTAAERKKLALAYYWLGVIEARSLDGFWITLSERHLEAAVRADPKGPIAAQAYSLLEETHVLGFGGSSGVQLPADVWNRLKELRELMGLED